MASPTDRAGGRRRYQSVYDKATGLWHCVKMDSRGNELSRSPGGNAIDAERYEDTMRRYGAWQKS